MKRCPWVGQNKPYYEKYHDEEWAVPVYQDEKLFEMLILEGAQAGLSWETILKRRAGYKNAFKNFIPEKVAKMSDSELEALLQDESIIRNRLKVFGARTNAIKFLEIQKEFGSFSKYVWQFVNEQPIVSHYEHLKEVPCRSEESDALSKDLKKRGFTFVGTKIIYAFMQAIGMVNDHLNDCSFKYKPLISDEPKVRK